MVLFFWHERKRDVPIRKKSKEKEKQSLSEVWNEIIKEKKMTKFSKKAEVAQPSIIRELYKVWLIPGMKSMSSGTPSKATFPVKEFSEISAELYKEALSDPAKIDKIFAYGVSEGNEDLREVLKDRYMYRYKNGNPQTDDLQIFAGAQQVIDLTARTFLDDGDVVLVEEHSYGGAMNAFRGYGGRCVGVKSDKDGMIPESLEEALQRETNVKIIYVVATFQNPMGIVTSLERRKAIYDLAVKYDVMVIEDSPYFELRYSGEYIPSIKSMDTTGHVIFAGSMSKILAPGLRVGFAIANKEVLAKLTIGKQVEDMNNAGYTQSIVSEYLKKYDLDAHIDECCDLYRRKRDVMLKALDEKMSEFASWEAPDGGLFVWITLPEGVSGDALTQHLIDTQKLIVTPGSSFRPDMQDSNCIRINFSIPTEDQIVEYIDLLANGVKHFMSNR